jgi:glucose-6-phosphate 1-dehydrogenase
MSRTSFSVDEKTRSSSNFFGGRREPEDCQLIINGGSGDLAKRKLFPSLANLQLKKQMPKKFKILAVGRKDMALEELLSGGQYSEGFRQYFLYVRSEYDAAVVDKL